MSFEGSPLTTPLPSRLTTLFAECKQDLGDFAIFSNEREIPAGSELASLWSTYYAHLLPCPS